NEQSMKCEEVSALRERIQRAKRVMFFTGAGMSAASGVPTYRGKGGIWKEYDHQEYACQEAFERAPQRVWSFHEKRRALVASCAPNPGHDAIAAFQKAASNQEVFVATQNIDGLHQRAGLSHNIVELHGSLWRVRVDTLDLVEENFDVPMRSYQHDSGAYWRPDITWFGDALHEGRMEQAQDWAEQSDVFVCVGTSGIVYPAAFVPLFAERAGAFMVEINPESSDLSIHCHLCLRGSAAEVLPALLDV
ncbi:MAG: NAD-dependent deacylase, partial [Myxococcota bacterium]